MSSKDLDPATRARLMSVSTATLCTALFKLGLQNQFIQDVLPLAPKAQNMMGQASTMRYITAHDRSERR